MIHGRVYAIRSHQIPEPYIGSTTQALSMQMASHRRNYKEYLNKKTNFITSFAIVQYSDSHIELLFEGKFESKDALRKKEGEYQRELDCVNKHIAGRTHQEYYEDNKGQTLKQQKQRYEENKDTILEQQKRYREENKENNLEQQKQRYEENKEKY